MLWKYGMETSSFLFVLQAVMYLFASVWCGQFETTVCYIIVCSTGVFLCFLFLLLTLLLKRGIYLYQLIFIFFRALMPVDLSVLSSFFLKALMSIYLSVLSWLKKGIDVHWFICIILTEKRHWCLLIYLYSLYWKRALLTVDLLILK